MYASTDWYYLGLNVEKVWGPYIFLTYYHVSLNHDLFLFHLPGLLSSGSTTLSVSGRFSHSIRSVASILSDEEKPILQRLSSNPYQTPYPKPVPIRLQRKRCSCSLFCRRFMYIGFCLFTFAVGLFCRLWFPAPMINIDNSTTTTIPSDITTQASTTLFMLSDTFSNLTAADHPSLFRWLYSGSRCNIKTFSRCRESVL